MSDGESSMELPYVTTEKDYHSVSGLKIVLEGGEMKLKAKTKVEMQEPEVSQNTIRRRGINLTNNQ